MGNVTAATSAAPSGNAAEGSFSFERSAAPRYAVATARTDATRALTAGGNAATGPTFVRQAPRAEAQRAPQRPARTDSGTQTIHQLAERRRELLKCAQARELSPAETRELTMVRWRLNVSEGKRLRPLIEDLRQRRLELAELRETIEAFVNITRG